MAQSLPVCIEQMIKWEIHTKNIHDQTPDIARIQIHIFSEMYKFPEINFKLNNKYVIYNNNKCVKK